MKRFTQHAITAALLSGLALTAIAQAPAQPVLQGGPGMMQGGGMHAHRGEGRGHRDPAKMAERMAKRQAELKQKLAITPQQESAWSAWTSAMKPPANMQRPNREEMAKLTTPERIDRMRQLRTQRQAEMDKRGDATKSFYATLSADQKKLFDAETSRMGRGMRGGHGGRHHG
jgi:protein CpxP